MAVSEYYEALVFEDGKRINVSRKVNMAINDQVHWHPYVEILLSLSDQNSAAVNFNSHSLRVNDIVLVYPGELHSVQSEQEESWFIIQFPIELLSGLSELNSLINRYPRRHYLQFDPAKTESELMALWIKKIVDLYDSSQLYKETKIYACMLNFFAQLGEYWNGTEGGEWASSGGKEQESLELMAQACLYITDHCGQSLSLGDVAHHVGISKSHFSHLFKHCTGQTFIDYLTTERIRRAETLSLDSSKSITDIAFEAGFSSISSFNRAFRKIKGITPSEFREKMIE